MTERSALLALAAHFTFKASIEQHGEHAVAAWRQAAELARAEAGRHQGAANGPGNVSGDAGRLSVDPGATDDGRWWLEPVPDARGGIDPRHPGYRVNAVAFNTLTEKVCGDGRVFMPLNLRQECTRAIVAAIGPMIVAAERERIARLAEEYDLEYECNDVAQGEFWRPFADLLREQPDD